jgi:integrase
MSVYLVKRKGWRYDFTLKNQRYTDTWFKTKAEAKRAEAKRKEELKNPPAVAETPTDMAFLDLLNKRLDYVQAYKSDRYYADYVSLGKRLVKEWGEYLCSQITPSMIQDFLIRRAKVSAITANKELRYTKALFNFGIKQGLINKNPAQGLEFMPVEKRLKYIPPLKDVNSVLLAADPDTQDYLVAITHTMARVGEINRLTWSDVDFDGKRVVLYTRKKRGGHLTPRKVEMTRRLFDMLSKRYRSRDKDKPWVFWHRYWSRKEKRFVDGPYQDRKRFMATLCRIAGVKYFRFHPLRHFGASVMDQEGVPIGSIQRILGHENRSTTEIYLHSIGEAEREAMAVFERAIQDGQQDESLTQTLTCEGKGGRVK